jgi:hypothetical protein
MGFRIVRAMQKRVPSGLPLKGGRADSVSTLNGEAMKRMILIAASLVLMYTRIAGAQSTQPQEDVRSFELTAVAPPSPAMKYQLRYDDLADRLPGDAVVLYMDAALLMGPDAGPNATKALDAFKAHDMKKFAELAPDAVNRTTVFQELELAARREHCDWHPPYRELGGQTLLPHLVMLLNAGRVMAVRALSEVDAGKPTDAVATLRVGYALSYKLTGEPTIVSHLVALRIESMLNDGVAHLMDRPDAPNLYWALMDLPARKPDGSLLDVNRLASATSNVPELIKAKNGEELSAEQWRGVLRKVTQIVTAEPPSEPLPDPITGVSADVMRQARAEYAAAHHLTPEQAQGVDAAIVIGTFDFHQYVIIYDETYKLHGLPYPMLLARTKANTARAEALKRSQPANPFVQQPNTGHNVIRTYARVDRQVAALACVEALRSYAAAHGGALPAKLNQIDDTPAPQNPATGRPFEYRVENGAAVLSDDGLEMPLRYTVKIRK